MDQLFATHKLNKDGMEKALKIAYIFTNALHELEQLCMEGREWSICKTKLEEASFFAKKAMAINPANQLQEEATSR